MRQLRIYFITTTAEQDLHVEVFPDILSVRDRWIEQSNTSTVGALLHIGHERPSDKNELKSLIGSYPGRVLGTEPCRWSLPPDYCFSATSISKVALHKGVAECRVYLAVQGFGYFIEREDSNLVVEVFDTPSLVGLSCPEYDGWLGHCIADNPSIRDVLVNSGIRSTADFDYEADKLSDGNRRRLSDYRDWFSRRKEEGDIVARILGAPPRFRTIVLNQHLRTVRLRNVFERNGIKFLGDLLRYSREQLLTLQHFGRTSWDDLNASLDDIFDSGGDKVTSLPVQVHAAEPSVFQISSDWLGAYLEQHGANRIVFDELQITSDAAYCAHRNRLSESVRDEADGFRFLRLIDRVNIYDPIQIVSICPGWFLKQPVDALALSNRVKNVIRRMKIVTVEELMRTNSFNLERQRNFGRKSLLDLSKGLIHGVKTNLDNCFRPDRQQQLTLLEHIQRGLDELKSLTRQIMISRLGLGSSKILTLEELAATHGLTRERIRQIEKKVVESWIHSKLWDDLLVDKLSELTRGREKPLLFDFLAIEDRWFDGFSEQPHALFAVIEKFACYRFYVYPVNDVNIITRVSKDEWEEMVREGSVWIREEALPNNATRAEISQYLGDMCRNKSAQEFETFLVDRCLDNLHFATDPLGSERLVAVGRGVEHLIRVVVEESSHPLHFTEIHRRCQEAAGRPLDIRRVFNACSDSEGVLLFSRGTYGVSRHLSMSDDVRAIVRDICEQVVCSAPPDRQWHCTELLEEVQDQVGPVDFNTYVLDLILVDSPSLVRLGRQVWVLKGGKAISNEDRAQIYDLALKALHDAGCPMPKRELLQKIGNTRGVRPNYQLHPTEHLIQIEPTIWGLTERDIPASLEEREWVRQRMYNLLHDIGRSLHFSEFSHHEIVLRRPQGISDYLTYSLCKMDDRFHGWSGGLLGLEEWGEPRALTVSEAFQRVLESLSEPRNLSEIQQMIEGAAGRKIDTMRVSALLAQSSCLWDPETESWSVPNEEVL